MNILRLLVLLVAPVLTFESFSFSSTPLPYEVSVGSIGNESFKRRNIVKEIFSANGSKHSELSHSLGGFFQEYDKRFVGQKKLPNLLYSKLRQWARNLNLKTNNLDALHIMGPHGSGKSSLIPLLENLGILVIKVNLHSLEPGQKIGEIVFEKLNKLGLKKVAPFVLFLDELDKKQEMDEQDRIEYSDIMGQLSRFLATKELEIDGEDYIYLENAFVLSALNFSELDLKEFALFRKMQDEDPETNAEPPHSPRSLTEFLEYHFKNDSSNEVYLQKVFSPTTSARIAPDLHVLSELTPEDHRKITSIKARETLEELRLSEKRIRIDLDNSFLDFVAEHATNVRLGAHHTNALTYRLVNQIAQIATRIQMPGISRWENFAPKNILIKEFQGQIVLEITQHVFRNGEFEKGREALMTIPFDQDLKIFREENLSIIDEAPVNPYRTKVKSKVRTRKEIVAARFPEGFEITNAIDQEIRSEFIGIESTLRKIYPKVERFLASNPDEILRPYGAVNLAGLPGSGKSGLIEKIANTLDIPVVRVNLPSFASEGENASWKFLRTLFKMIYQAKAESKSGHVFVVFEELDNVHDKVLGQDDLVEMPWVVSIIASIKELLETGTMTAMNPTTGGRSEVQVSMNGVMTFFTMNFAKDIFKFKADPNFTTVEAVQERLDGLSSIEKLKAVLEDIFSSELVDRLLENTIIMNGLSRRAYYRVVDKGIKNSINRLPAEIIGSNIGQVEFEFSKPYIEYLRRETIVPALMVRHTLQRLANIVDSDIEKALKSIWKSKKQYQINLLRIRLHYYPGKIEVVAFIQYLPIEETGKKDQSINELQWSEPVELYRAHKELNFPSLKITGKLDLKRLNFALHEVGHAFLRMLLGFRFEIINAASTQQGVGGYVSYSGGQVRSGRDIIGELSTLLGGYIFERLFESENPFDPEASFYVSKGPVSDVEKISNAIYGLAHEFALVDGMGIMALSGDPVKSPIDKFPAAYGQVLGEIVEEFAKEVMRYVYDLDPSLEILEAVILEVAYNATMNEKKFFEKFGHPYPGKNKEKFNEINRPLRNRFADHLKSLDEKVEVAGNFTFDGDPFNDSMTASERLDYFTIKFREIFDRRKPDLKDAAKR